MKLFNRILLSLITLSFLFSANVAAVEEDELLPPEKAFAMTAWMEDDLLIAEIQIAPGYYMYRKRFDFPDRIG